MIVVTEKQRDDVSSLKAELDKKYTESLQEIESYRAENAGLDSLLTVKEQELTAKKAKIDALLGQISTLKAGDATKSKLLADVQLMIAQMESDKVRLQASIDSLVTVNKALYQERDSITGELTTTIQRKQQLDAEKLRICFDLIQNKIAPAGQTEIAVRIISPDGTTIQLQNLGSGTFKEATTGNEIPFTYNISPDYQNDTKTVCSYWAQTFKFAAGKYSVEIYEKGFLIGQSSFMMK